MSVPWSDLVWICNRYAHILFAMMLVGGTFFYALVVPRGIDDLKDTTQLAVLARLRWVFRWIVYLSTVGLIISGVASWTRNNWSYSGSEVKALALLLSHEGKTVNFDSLFMRSGLWFALHSSLAIIALISSVAMIRSFVPPNHPIGWLRLSVVLLLLAALAASMTRNARVRIFESIYWKDYNALPASTE